MCSKHTLTAISPHLYAYLCNVVECIYTPIYMTMHLLAVDVGTEFSDSHYTMALWVREEISHCLLAHRHAAELLTHEPEGGRVRGSKLRTTQQ